MSRPVVAALIPVWNLWPMTRDCLRSLALHTPPGLLEVCVVDNGSTDETARELEPLGRSLFGERFRLERLGDNFGFAVATNAAARLATTDLVLFLNNDTLALPGWLPPLVEGLNALPGGNGAVGPLLLYEGGERVQHCGVAFSYTGVQHLYAHFPAGHPAVSGERAAKRRLQAMTAAALLMPRDLFLELGLFHEAYTNGFEDLDLCRTLIDSGGSLRCVPGSRLIHRESQTPGRKTHDAANAAVYAGRWPQALVPDIFAFAREDGFAIFLNEALETCIGLPPRQEADLNRHYAQETNPRTLWDVLKAFPLWKSGYARLAGALAEAGRPDDALYVRVLESQLFPGVAAARALERAARTSRNEALALEAAGEVQRLQTILRDKPSLVRKASALSRLTRRDRNVEAETLYLDWLRRNGS